MNTDELIVHARQNCCRLCLAPDSECVPIFTSYAADKEPISIKIQTCVNIKVTQEDRLSLKICHYCVSYLNSWQSFKNRCIASQTKQQYWLDIAAKNLSTGKVKKPVQSKFVPSFNNNRKSMTTSMKQGKGERKDDKLEKQGEEETLKVDLDPTEFFVKNDEEDSVNDTLLQNPVQEVCGDDPPILSSLGLTHIASVNPYSFLSTELGHQEINQTDAITGNLNTNVGFHNDQTLENLPRKLPKTLSSCSVCKLAFSTRANARRHERNIHGKMNLFSFSGRRSLIKKLQVTPEIMGIYDYSKPEKYRHLLTEQKLVFIRRNEIFLKQYQDLTCNCCLKTHPTYKNFMAHMRKKYPTLGRNLCFKCLKQFQTKAMFVSHLKKKCCINLYKLYLADDTIPKDGPLVLSPEKMGTKDLLTNKIYECKLCAKTSRLKMEFRSHVTEYHSDIYKKDISPGHCGFCGIQIEDTIERKRHYNNMECIVTLKCVTCEKKFENHQSFVDHVYEAHLPHHQMSENEIVDIEEDEDDVIMIPKEKLIERSNKNVQIQNTPSNKLEPQIREVITLKKEVHRPIDSRSPQSCKICGQHYNNYNNVLRHMEAKHPDQLPETYKCTMCNAGFARMSMLREHMLDKHGKKVPKYTRRDTLNTNATTPTTSISGPMVQFECKICLNNFPSIDKWIAHQADTHEHFSCFQCNFQNKNIDEFTKHVDTHSNFSRLKLLGDSNIKLSNNSSPATLIKSTNESKTSKKYDYIMTDLLEIRNGIKMQEELKNEGKTQSPPPQKKIKMETDLKECQICHAIFNSNLGLSNHMRTHNSQLQQQQQSQNQNNKVQVTQKTNGNRVCSKTYFGVTASDLLRRIRCRLCQRRFSTKKGYKKHMLIDHQVKNVEFIKCSICNADFTHEKGLKLHIMRVHDTAPQDILNTMDSKVECNQCELVFKEEEQLNVHKMLTHNEKDNMQKEQGEVGMSGSTVISVQSGESGIEINYWFQCRYCPAHFDTNKKLAIHTNSHDEFDSNDYSCKDCGNVYSGRKSLWVHRYKKHPLIPDPSKCTICEKTFFDKNMLEMHLKNYSHANLTNKVDNFQLDDNQSDEMYNTAEDFDDGYNINDEHENREFNKDIENNLEIEASDEQQEEVPEVRCTVCNLKLTDVESFTKHMNMHEMELYTDNPLAAMFDTGPEDPNKFYESRLGENGEYMCDICPKTFSMLTAFKVHRNWHFRSDGKQVPADPNTTWRGVQKKKKDPATSIKCQYCNSLFINHNNLKRHVMELHKRETSKGEAPKVFIEKYLECRRCEMKFRYKAEWITHKLEHVKSATVDSTVGWGCEICGKIVSRKERLVQHVKAHMREDDQLQQMNDGNGYIRSSDSYNRESNEEGFESNSQDSNSIGGSSDKEQNEKRVIAHVTSDGIIMRSCDSENEGDADDDDENNENDFNCSTSYKGHEEESRSDSEGSSIESDDYDNNDDEPAKERYLYSCDLCKVRCETSKQLHCHLTSHFLNGPGSVTLTETEKKSEDEET